MVREESQPLPSEEQAWREGLAEEIADHLEQSARDGEISGQLPKVAKSDALRRFGSVEKTYFHCWWIHQKEQIMLSVLRNSFLLAGVVVLVVMMFLTWSQQRELTGQLNEMRDSLQSVAEFQQQLAAAAAEPPVITVSLRGKAYLGFPDVPVQDYPLTVKSRYTNFRRLLKTDAEGQFTTGDIPTGDYQLSCQLVDGYSYGSGYSLTTEYFALNTPGDTKDVQLDLDRLDSRVTVRFVPEMPLKIPTRRGEADVALMVQLPTIDQNLTHEKMLDSAGWDYSQLRDGWCGIRVGQETLRGCGEFSQQFFQHPEQRGWQPPRLSGPVHSGRQIVIMTIRLYPHNADEQNVRRMIVPPVAPSLPIGTFDLEPDTDVTLEIHWPGEQALTEIVNKPNRFTCEDFELKVVSREPAG